ncbi:MULTISPECIES: DUF2147 domain-containing protein [unclassified Methylibium]|nr:MULTISPECIES: DUF2147 domain-containing protein [unclassified Methylibium]EWS55161.1 hypothetical protein X551_02037 [Methylibium sp. T29]EWS60679.1 hypothetical protein Y694_01551 [Methylibium sp. T29-B]
MKHVITACLLSLAALAAQAQATPAGLWKTVDDDTGKEKSLVRIAEAGGVYTGKVEKLLDPARQDAKCDKCSDERKGQPVLGMTIIRDAKQDSDDKGLWTGGDITDPKDGKSYRLRLKPQDGGKTLEVRGYVGPFYRNQTWIRVE